MKYKKYLIEHIEKSEKFKDNVDYKTILNKIHEYIEKYYNCKIKRSIPTGKINFETGKSEISYILFGENLPFRNYYYILEEE